MTLRWSTGRTYRAAKPAHRWRVVAPNVKRCRICDVTREHLKYGKHPICEFRFPGGESVVSQRTPACAGVQ